MRRQLAVTDGERYRALRSPPSILRLRAAAAELGAGAGAGAVGIELDVRDPAWVSAAVESVYEALGGVDRAGQQRRDRDAYGQPAVHDRAAALLGRGARRLSRRGGDQATGTFRVARAVVPRMLSAGGGRIVTVSMNKQTMTRRGFIPCGPSGAAVEALARVMAADLAGTNVTAKILLPGGATATGMIPEEMPDEVRETLLAASIMGPLLVWLASPAAAGLHDERIIARDFAAWLAARGVGTL